MCTLWSVDGVYDVVFVWIACTVWSGRVGSGLVTVMFVDLITLHTQLSSWLFALSGAVQSAYEHALVYCEGSKLKDFGLVIRPLTEQNVQRDASGNVYHSNLGHFR